MASKSEHCSFEDRKTSNQKMSSMQRIKSWDEDGGKRNPLHNLHFDKVRRREVYATLEPPATNTKLTEYRRNVKQQTQPDCELNAPSKVYSNKMKVFADQLPTYELLPQWETNIRNLIPSYLQNCFPDHLQNQMNEIKLRYCQAMHTFGVNCIAAVQYGFEIPVLSDPAFKFLGHTEWRGKYLMNRCIISKKFYLPHKLIKNILAQAHTLLPEFICDFRQYRSHGYLDLNRLLNLIEADIKKGAQMITNSYYTYIVRLVSQPRYIHDVPSSAVPRFLVCATRLLACQIIQLKINTVEHFLDVLSHWSSIPLLKLELKCENNGLFVDPSMSEVYSSLHDLIDEIANLAEELLTFESWMNIKTDREFIRTALPSWYLEKSHRRLTDVLEKTYEPLNEHVQTVGAKFSTVFDPKTRQNIVAYVNKGHEFEDCLEEVENFNRFISEINGMSGCEYFLMCKLRQEEAKKNLKKCTEGARQLIIEELTKRHRKFNLDICEAFENIQRRVLSIPLTTKELLELGQYMLYAASTSLEELRGKITHSLHMMASLIGMTTIDKDHIELNNTTIHWLKRIKPVFELHSSMFEQMKFELEEQLQEKVRILNNEVLEMFPRLVIMDSMDDATRIHEYIEDMRKFVRRLDRMDEQAEWINREELLFQLPQSTYPRIKELKENILPFYSLISRAYRWQRDLKCWLDGPFEYLDATVIEDKVIEYYSDLKKMSKTFKTKIKLHLAMGYPYSFQGSADDPDELQQPTPMKLSYQLIETIKWFRQFVPLIQCFCNSALRQRHWDEITEIAGIDLTPNAGTTLRKIIEMDLMDDMDRYNLISVSATKELALHDLFTKIIHEWDGVIFTTTPFKDSGAHILTQLDDIQALLEDHIVKVQAMRGSTFVKLIATDVKMFYDLLLRIQRTINEWTKVQVQWMYLLPIFSSKDIVAQLPEEGTMFSEVDGIFRRAMLGVARDPRVKDTAGSVGLLEAMIGANELMDKVNEGVSKYLEEKRLYFPRFFFLSNDDMLEILSETKNPLRVQPHLKKCFEGIAKLGFNEFLEIFAMFSDDQEEVKFQELISTEAARGCVERWLVQVEEQMRKSVRHEVFLSYLDYEVNDRIHWVRIWPGMVVLGVSQIYWSIEVQNCLITRIASTMDSLYEKLRQQIIDVVNLVKGQLSKQNRTTLNALITMDVHALDVVKLLIDKHILNETDFDWLAQLRYYWEDDVLVRIINATVPYAYEYLGNCPRLVITPLTDRCYRTLIGAYSLHLNGAPEGPAGTGKTETTKDLGRALAVQCVVFNCSDGLDYKNMGKFFKGLASCGAWACFDEFNRIELEVLSVVAQQILCIVQAVRGKLEKLIFEGTELKLNPAVYVCITMNPGYAGRSELPDNLKVLFRTVAMMVPDYAMIGEIFLYSSGFNTARALAVKIVTTYKLCSEELSLQSHYDYGMRAVKTVLIAAQKLKMKFPNDDETIVMLRAIVDVNLPKFLAYDVPLFEGIISDLFPDTILPLPKYDVLMAAVTEATRKRNLQPMEGFLRKIIETFEMMTVRHGFMLVGAPFGGKTALLRTLSDALILMHEWGDDTGTPMEMTTMNPKSITMGQLYGQFDPVSSEWTDGICATTFRRYAADESPRRKWIIFDGPVDAVWIENLNTVLDDNKKLCLTSGEVMQMSSTMSIIFEVMDLLQASPATVSRCGMIYIEPQVLGWRPFVKSWINGADPIWKEGHEDVLNHLFEWLCDPCLDFIRKRCRVVLGAGEINRVTSTLNLFEMFMANAVEESTQDCEPFILSWLQAAMLMSMVWGAAGTLDFDSRCSFNEYYLSFWRNERKSHPVPESIKESLIALPTEGLLHDNFYTFKAKGGWKSFADVSKAEKIGEARSVGQTLVPTIDSIKYQSLMTLHIKYRRRFLLYGETGTGKSFYVRHLMTNKLAETEYLPIFVTFTAKTTAAQMQELVISKLFKRRRGQYGPRGGAFCIAFIDDVNMPAKEMYGAQPVIELLRQFFDHAHWYDLKSPDKLEIFDIMFSCAMAPPGGSRQRIYDRFLRHFNMYTICNFSEESIFRIFTNTAHIGLRRNNFGTEILSTVNGLVNATMDVFESARKDLRPTPTRSHYLFNLRDFSRVIAGCTMIKKESVESKSTFTRLWVHEILRVFGDRLIDVGDRTWLLEKIKETVTTTLKESFDSVFARLPKFNENLTVESMQSLIFGKFMDTEALPEDRKYEEIVSMDEYREVAVSCLEEYNHTHKNKVDMILFRFALEHLARICRILVIPSGSLLMVGVGGSGRQSLTRLASSMIGYSLFQPEIGSAYGPTDWREDIKKVTKSAGAVGNDLVFLLTDGQIRDESFLEDIDSLLNSGEVPNLLSVEEKQEIVELTRLAAQNGNRNLDISVLAVLAFYLDRCKEKLHIMLGFSPIGESFRNRLRLYPSLVSCCTIDWFEVWPDDALEEVALRWIAEVNVDEDTKVNAIIASKYFHAGAKDISSRYYREGGRKTYVTSAAFLDLIRSYADLMRKKQDELVLARDRYLGGLDKLEFAAQQTSEIKSTLTALQPELQMSARLTENTMRKIEIENASVAETTAMVKRDEESANVQAEITGALKAECEADLAKALPALEEAVAALNTLKPEDITLVKAMKNPPEGVKLVMAAICVMMNIQPDRIPDPSTGRKILHFWGPSKRLLNDMRFLDNLRDYDKDNIPSHVIQVINKSYLTNKNFEPKIVAKASQAAEGLCKWVRAIILYDKVAKVVAPKKAKLEAAEKDFRSIMSILNEKRQMLLELNAKLAALNEQLQEALINKINLENEVTLCRNKLIRAEKLILGLGDEQDRWILCAENLEKSYDCLPGDLLLSCGMISYLGPFASIYRTENLEKWRIHVLGLKIPCSEAYSFEKVLGTEIKINSWHIYGLPRDSFSTENAIIMDNSRRWSLFVDPQSQANKWIRALEKVSELEVIKLTDKNYMDVIERSIEYGKPVLIENVGEDLDAALDPILMKNVYVSGGTWFIALGERTIEYSLRFRLYVTTKLRNPHYLPEVFNKVTLINFALSIEGLEDQLLGIVVAKERPDLQEKREYLIVQGAANKKALQQVEDNILKTLSGTGGSILEDEEATEILDSSKILSIDILKKQEAAKETEAKIENFRESYKPVAKHGSALYYTLTDLPAIDPMYQYSLTWFIDLYIFSIETANKSRVLERRLMFLRDTFTYNLYQNVCRSLFEKDKILYSFLLYTTILLYNNEIRKDEMTFFLTGGVALENLIPNPAADWLSDGIWGEICRTEDIQEFNGFIESFKENLSAWKDYYDLPNPQNCPIPDPWENTLKPFEKLIVMKLIRPDKITTKVIQFVESGMGSKFLTNQSFDISKSYRDSNCLTPLIFILSPGSDPMDALINFAGNMDMSEKFDAISLGQGQGPIARKLIERAQNEGSWVCLQNCHLAVSWMPVLERICENFDTTNTSINFRLWLTSYPSEKFPIAILQHSVKMTNDPPTGLQQNLTRLYRSEPVNNPEFFEGCPGKEKSFTRLLYSLCFFHAVILERRDYGSQGWNIKYGFNESDFHISVQQLQLFINEYDQVPFKAITYLTGECNYGGRVTDDRDRRCLNTLLADFYNPNVIEHPTYSFAEMGSEYTVPKRTEYRDYVKQIEAIPLTTPPEVLGLHMNAGIARDLNASKSFFDSMLKIQGSVTGGEPSKQDELLLTMKSDIYERLPDLFDIEEAQNVYPATYVESMNTVLTQEMERFNVLLAEIRSSLSMLERAINGSIVMTPELEVLASHMINGKIPPSWVKASAYPSLKPLLSFVSDFLQRLAFLKKWLLEGKPNAFWISGFSFVHSFLTATTQNYARKYKIPIDMLDFDFKIMPMYRANEAPDDGAYVYGVYLTGAKWNMQKMLLAESDPKVLWDLMPIVWILPRKSTSIVLGNRYECPVYITSERYGTLKTTGHSTNYVLCFFLDTDMTVSHWIKRGLALLCQLDD